MTPVREWQPNAAVAASVERSRDYRLGLIDGRAESAAEIEGLRKALHWSEQRLAEADMMLRIVREDGEPVAWVERVSDLYDRHRVFVNALAVALFLVLFVVLARWA
jgi:hypothetical protein